MTTHNKKLHISQQYLGILREPSKKRCRHQESLQYMHIYTYIHIIIGM